MVVACADGGVGVSVGNTKTWVGVELGKMIGVFVAGAVALSVGVGLAGEVAVDDGVLVAVGILVTVGVWVTVGV